MAAIAYEFSVAWRNILRQRHRSAIAGAAVSFGVAALMLAGGFIDFMLDGMREWTIKSQLGHIQIVKPGYGKHGLSDPFAYLLPDSGEALRRIESQPHVAAVAPRLAFNGLVSRGDATISFIGQGMAPEKERLLSSSAQVVEGNDLDEADPRGIIIGRGLASNLGVRVSDTVVLMAMTSSGGMNAVECRVRGFFATSSKAFDDVALRAPISMSRDLLKVSGSHVWVVLLDRTAQTGAVLMALRTSLAGERLEFIPWSDLADLYKKTVALFGRQVDVMKFIVALIIVLSISNTMTMNVIERTGEIGTALALGLRRRSLVRMFLLEGLVLGLAGAAVGVAVGGGLASLISTIGIPMPPPPGMARGYTAEILVTLPLVRDSALLAVGTALAASLYPAWKASKMVIIDALRHNR